MRKFHLQQRPPAAPTSCTKTTFQTAQKLKTINFLALLFATINLSQPAHAANLTCAQNRQTNAMTCFAENGVRQNGDVRAAKVYMGGPNEITESSINARVFCKFGVLELADRKGIVFARSIPEEQVGKDFIRFICQHKKTRTDKKLKTD